MAKAKNGPTMSIVCALRPRGANVFTSVGKVGQADPVEVPLEEAESLIASGMAREVNGTPAPPAPAPDNDDDAGDDAPGE